MANSTENNQTTKFYDLHTHGLGYVNRIREVLVKRGEPFWACDISALHGAEDTVESTRFDCRVSGSIAAKVIKRLDKSCQEDKKILIGFKIGDLYPETFTYKSGEKQGEIGISLKARLLYISWVKVDGDNVYMAPPKAEPVKDNSAVTRQHDEQTESHVDEAETAKDYAETAITDHATEYGLVI